MEKDLTDLITQIEYYFSDKNLEYDEFFFTLIQDETYVPLEKVMSCNKVKKMSVT